MRMLVVRTLKHKQTAGGAAALESRTLAGEESLGRQLVLMALWGLVGILVPRATVYGGMSPFGVGVAAAVSGPGSLVVYLAAGMGYLLPDGAVYPLRYLAAVAAVAGIRWALNGMKKLTAAGFFAPLTAFLATGFTGMALTLMNKPSLISVLTVVAESLLAGGFAYFVATAFRITHRAETKSLTAQEQSSVVAVAAVVLMAVSTIQFSGISPGRIVSILLILLLARCGKEQGGSIAGIVLGTAMALAAPDQMFLAPAYALGGLMAGVFSRFGKLASAASFVAVNTIVTFSVMPGLEVVVGFYEVAAASVLYVALPSVFDKRINALFSHAKDIPAVDGLRRSVVLRMDFAAKAMQEVAGTVDSVSKKLAGLSAPDLGSVYRGVSDDVCRVCGLKMFCWEQHFSETMDSFNNLTPLLREKGGVNQNDVKGHLARHCGRIEEVVRRVNMGYREHLVREGAWRRLAEIRTVATGQFGNMSEMLEEMARDFSVEDKLDPDAAVRVTGICEEHGLTVQDVVCSVSAGNRMTVDILASDQGARIKERVWREEIGEACGRDFDHPTVTRVGDSVRISLNELPVYQVAMGSAQLTCSGEKLCGDAVESFQDGGGRTVVVLSDGMGSGGRAAVDGAMAAGLTSRLLQADFGPDSVLRMVNSALMVKSGDESLATLDIASINLFTGRLESLKAGAAASLLRSKGRVSRMERSSLPVGILREVSFERCSDTLVDGDILLLMSDGVLTDGIAWVEELLRDYDADKGSMKDLAEKVVTAARKRQEGQREDDITAVALHVKKASR